MILAKQSFSEVNQLVHPNSISTIKIGKSVVQERVLRSVWGFFLSLCFFSAVFFIWALNLLGYDLVTSFATVAACINNMGIGYGATVQGFGNLDAVAKWMMCAAMLLGRLEIYPILILCSKVFWRF